MQSGQCYLHHLQMMQNAFNNKHKVRVASEYFVIDAPELSKCSNTNNLLYECCLRQMTQVTLPAM